MLANKLRGEELNTYGGILNEAKNWPVIKYLVNTVKDNLVDDVTITDSITPAQLRDAYKGYWCAQKIASVAVKTKSEWKKDPARWNALDKIFGHTDANPNKNWLTEKTKIEKLSFWDEVSGVVGNSDGKVWGLNSLLISSYMKKPICSCDEDFLFGVYKYGSEYGPGYQGVTELESYPGWQRLLNGDGVNRITALEKSNFCAMSPNEGNMEAIQSYDSEILTAGCMQKTVSPNGKGQFSSQVSKFKALNPHLYSELFEECGWIVSGSESSAELKYRDPNVEDAPLLAGAALKKLIRAGFNQEAHTGRLRVTCKSLACLIPAISHPKFLELQVIDFVIDLRETLKITAVGYNSTVGDYFKSAFGQSIALDHHVNRPGHVGFYLGKALDKFYSIHPELSSTIVDWGENHSIYEEEILEIYGPLRGDTLKPSPMTAATQRYNKIKDHFN